MRKLLSVVFALAVVAPSAVFAAKNHPMAGCGLGYVLLSHDDNTKGMQIIGATTNATGTQTFGITSGTSGCTEDGAVKFAKSAETYAEVNLDSLRQEMAQGQGEYVRTFASLLGANGKNVDTLVEVFQSNYTTLFPTSDTSTADMLASLHTLLYSNQALTI